MSEGEVSPEGRPGVGARAPRFRDRVWSLRALVVVAVVSVVLGGLVGAALIGLVSHDERHRAPAFGRIGGPHGPGPRGRPGTPLGPGHQWHWGDGPRGEWRGGGPGDQQPPNVVPMPTPRSPSEGP